MRASLVLIDLQEDFLSSPGLALARRQICASAARLLEGFRAAAVPVVHVWTTVSDLPDRRMPHWRHAGDWRCRQGTPGHATPAELTPLASEHVVHKTGYSGFHDTPLERLLRGRDTSAVVLAGVHLHGCVRATALDAYQRGFEVWVTDDAVGGEDAVHADITRRYLAARGTTFAPVADVLARWTAAPISVDRAGKGEGPLLPAVHLGDRTVRDDGLCAYVHVSPRRPEETLWRVPEAAAGSVTEAVACAADAAARWRQTRPGARAKVLTQVADRLAGECGALTRQMAVEIGKPIVHGRGEVAFAIDLVRAAARRVPRVHDAVPSRTTARRRPLGVVALITPWNNPVAIPLGKLAPALAFGNAVVWKPAPEGAARALAIAEWLIEAGLPPGVVTLVLGGRTAAERLMAHAGIDGIALTGSLQAGVTARAMAAQRGVPLQAELGGNNGAIVWSDADLAAAASAIADGAFASAGQRCTATRRAIVERGALPAFMAHLEAATANLGWGDPLDEAVSVGPLVSACAHARVCEAIARAAAEGSSVVAPHLARGHSAPGPFYTAPTIIAARGPGQEIVQEETFAPVLVVQEAGDWSEALALLDDVRHGLAASLFSTSAARRADFLARARAGVLKLDRGTAGVAADLPFGGWKASGVGPPEHAAGDREFYTRAQAVYL